jgi:hypothetical protein
MLIDVVVDQAVVVAQMVVVLMRITTCSGG